MNNSWLGDNKKDDPKILGVGILRTWRITPWPRTKPLFFAPVVRSGNWSMVFVPTALTWMKITNMKLIGISLLMIGVSNVLDQLLLSSST
jgi:hypothetical protein